MRPCLPRLSFPYPRPPTTTPTTPHPLICSFSALHIHTHTRTRPPPDWKGFTPPPKAAEPPPKRSATFNLGAATLAAARAAGAPFGSPEFRAIALSLAAAERGRWASDGEEAESADEADAGPRPAPAAAVLPDPLDCDEEHFQWRSRDCARDADEFAWVGTDEDYYEDCE